jgi:hypothetical protein
MGLPALSQPQFIVRSASFAEPNEVLRFTQRFESEFSRLWISYPARRKSSAGPDSVDEVQPHTDNLDMSR